MVQTAGVKSVVQNGNVRAATPPKNPHNFSASVVKTGRLSSSSGPRR